MIRRSITEAKFTDRWIINGKSLGAQESHFSSAKHSKQGLNTEKKLGASAIELASRDLGVYKTKRQKAPQKAEKSVGLRAWVFPIVRTPPGAGPPLTTRPLR